MLRELIKALEEAYCRKIGVDYMHISDVEECKWIRDTFEKAIYQDYSRQKKIQMLDRIFWTDEFATFIGTKFNTMKRFGLEGCESFIPGMKSAIDKLVEFGGERVVIGMPHRGRLNMLANVVQKPLETIFAEFQGVTP